MDMFLVPQNQSSKLFFPNQYAQINKLVTNKDQSPHKHITRSNIKMLMYFDGIFLADFGGVSVNFKVQTPHFGNLETKGIYPDDPATLVSPSTPPYHHPPLRYASQMPYHHPPLRYVSQMHTLDQSGT